MDTLHHIKTFISSFELISISIRQLQNKGSQESSTNRSEGRGSVERRAHLKSHVPVVTEKTWKEAKQVNC